MKIGIICEGHSDRAVITNILEGTIGFNSSDIIPLRPTDQLDETDKANLPSSYFSTWSLVKRECEDKQRINDFLSIEGQEFIVIHIDTAESAEYQINKPLNSSLTYCKDLRKATIEKINEWLKETEPVNNFLYAVAIEEMDAWVLVIYENKNSSIRPNPKRRLEYILAKKNINTSPGYANYLILSKDFRKSKIISDAKLLSLNESLSDFCKEIRNKVLPFIELHKH